MRLGIRSSVPALEEMVSSVPGEEETTLKLPSVVSRESADGVDAETIVGDRDVRRHHLDVGRRHRIGLQMEDWMR